MQAAKEARYSATPVVRQVIDEQGRRQTWLADHLGVDQSLVSRILAGRRTVSEPDARLVSNILGAPFSLLWKLAGTSESCKTDEHLEEVA